MTQKITISTAIAYPNARPHLGHALEFIQADALSRFYRLSGYDVMFTTGTDEHGTKIFKTATDEGMTPQELVDRNSEYFKEMCKLLHVQYDLFLRTSDEMLREGAKKLWKKLIESGDLEKGTYEGLYCYGCENYMLEKDLVDGMCPNHMRAPEKLSEENYFFKLSKYIPWLKEHLSNTLEVKGEFRKTEILNMLEDLSDVSFSRPKTALPWGVEVPDDPDHVMYVWCDALANYLTGLDYVGEGENYEKYWPTSINIIGKDIMKFHAIFWPAMIKSAGLPLPEKLYVHGFVTSEGKKMSKSLGNVVDPVEFGNEYGADALRFYLLSQISTQDDGDFAKDRFFECYGAHLANNVGNLVSRVVAMTVKYFEGNVSLEGASNGGDHTLGHIQEVFEKYSESFKDYDLKKASDYVLQVAEYANKFVEDSQPWTLSKEGKTDQLHYVLYHLLEVIRVLAVMLVPFIPEKAYAIGEYLGLEGGEYDFDGLFDSRNSYSVKKGDPLFPRLELREQD